ncbi:MAG: DUF5931 domain-containing protein, partial [Sciscionella sp.]
MATTSQGNDQPAVPRGTTRPLWRGTAFLRAVTYLFALGTTLAYYPGYARKDLAIVVLVAMGVWTVCTVLAYLRQVRWMVPVVLADVLVTCGLMLSSVLILSADQFANSVPLITTVWAAPTPVAAGLLAGRTAGAGVGLLVMAVTAVCRDGVNTDVIRDGVLLVGSGFLIGMAASTARASARRLARALRAEAANAERERLARSIHDSVLQVLARVRRRGAELGGQAAELAALAGEQEIALRALMGSTPAGGDNGGEDDLRARLGLLASSRVQVALPATQVMLPAH